jgi:KUP system potassium uptake protein
LKTDSGESSGSHPPSRSPSGAYEAVSAGTEKTHLPAAPEGKYLAILTVGALGVVFGDIGTSPLYALRECFTGHHPIPPSPANVLGILSLIFWALILTISIKYLGIVLRADNRGEGGILALMALLRPPSGSGASRHVVLVALGLFGAALLYGDSIITPAITVLSAVEGLEIVTPAFKPYIQPIVVVILIVLFLIQKKGTAGVGAVFGPVMVLWFIVLAVLGVAHIFDAPRVLAAVNPAYGVHFFADNGLTGFLLLGSVFLVVTGGEALYADMGHFGARPIRVGWFAFVLPSLLLNYFGQGALLLTNPAAAANPLFGLAPKWGLLPLVLLATAASVIASQAVISGAFSLTRQAIQLGYMPRLRIDHTSEKEIGQIYLPSVNWALALSCIWLVLSFRTSGALAAAYGVAVTTTMGITTVLLYVYARETWKVSRAVAAPIAAALLVVDLAFFGANIVKIGHGGWVPLAIAFFVYTVMTTWKKGRIILADRLREASLPVDVFLQDVEKRSPTRVRGTAVFMDRTPEGIPPPLLHNLKHNKILHDRIVFLTVVTDEVPRLKEKERTRVQFLGPCFWRVTLHYGFMENPDVPRALRKLKLDGKGFEPMETTFFLGRETLIASKRPGMALWREHVFAWMARSEGRATAFFNIPPGRVVELGLQVEL